MKISKRNENFEKKMKIQKKKAMKIFAKISVLKTKTENFKNRRIL